MRVSGGFNPFPKQGMPRYIFLGKRDQTDDVALLLATPTCRKRGRAITRQVATALLPRARQRYGLPDLKTFLTYTYN